MQTRTRKAVGCLALLAYMALYVGAAVTLSALATPHLPWWGDLIFFTLAGVVWVIPLRPLFFWMNGVNRR